MNLTFDASITQNVAEATRREWLETNGVGGWASSTLAGMNTRRYHGLLVAASKPPVGRQVLLSRLDETLYINGQRYDLGANQYPGKIYPQGYQHLTQFSRAIFPEAIYEAGGVRLRRTIAALNGENTTLVIYDVLRAEQPFQMEWLPLVAGRDYHSLTHANDAIQPALPAESDVLHIQPYPDLPHLFVRVPGAFFRPQPAWYYQFEYTVERERGLDFEEDLFTPGFFSRELREGDTIGVIISTQPTGGRDAVALLQQERQRREALLAGQSFRNDWLDTLRLAADQFIVKRGADLKTVIAGYHWFADWGRDTMIALPGLCLATGRFAEARDILRAYAQAASQGMLPNRFPDSGEPPEYNSVDAALWFFVAIYQYRQYTNDHAFVRTEMVPVLRDILEWYLKGTRYHIHVDRNGLLYAGEPGVQLTWMDAKVGNWVVTPRQGNPVEVNALWYNALRIYGEFARDYGQDQEATRMAVLADGVKEVFQQLFWNPDKSCLYDYLNDGYSNDNIRPNQLFSISLPFPLLTIEKARKVLQIVEKMLYTPVGLRSLSPGHVEYKPYYSGDQWSRDGAYHQGTVWSWLLGPYIDALIRVKGLHAGGKQAQAVLKAFEFHLRDAGVGTISEVFDAEPPHTPKGCIAQAWSVGELLRVITEYRLLEPVFAASASRPM